MSEFRAVEEAIRNRQSDEAAQERMLEQNLQRALRQSIRRRFYQNRDEYLRDLEPGNFFYENPTSDRVYYVKFKYFIVRYDFERDPQDFRQAPVYEKMLILDDFPDDGPADE